MLTPRQIEVMKGIEQGIIALHNIDQPLVDDLVEIVKYFNRFMIMVALTDIVSKSNDSTLVHNAMTMLNEYTDLDDDETYQKYKKILEVSL